MTLSIEGRQKQHSCSKMKQRKAQSCALEG